MQWAFSDRNIGSDNRVLHLIKYFIRCNLLRHGPICFLDSFTFLDTWKYFTLLYKFYNCEIIWMLDTKLFIKYSGNLEKE